MPRASSPRSLAIVGGGAAGVMAAIWAARHGAQVSLLEGSTQCGRKILISGGGRCNLLPTNSSIHDFYTSGSRNVLKRLFRTWRLEQIQNFFPQELNLPLEEEEATGKLFPQAQKAKIVRDTLLEAAVQAGVQVLCPFRVVAIEKFDDGFSLHQEEGKSLHCHSLILATGGMSVPQTGSDGFGYRLAKKLGHKILPTYPALVPLTSQDKELQQLAGLSVEVGWRAVKNNKTLDQGVQPLLFTHQGFSGPAILDASHWVVRDKAELLVAWENYSTEDWEPYLKSRVRQGLLKALADQLPRRLAALLLARSGLREDMRCGNLDRGKTQTLFRNLCDFPLPIHSNRGFAVAEVTGGGIPLHEINPSTMESRKCPNLFLCGEILDVFGRIGGYNFQWAFISGRLAGEQAAKSLLEH